MPERDSGCVARNTAPGGDSVGSKSHVPGSQHAKTALLVELLERREAVSCRKTHGLQWAAVHMQK